jgi:cystathionine gamma-lyase
MVNDSAGFSTKAVHAGEEIDYEHGHGDVVTPLHLTTTYARKTLDEVPGGYDYIRSGNPTRTVLEKKLAAVENAAHAFAFSSGLAAETSLLLAFLKEKDHIVAFDDLYGGTLRIFRKILPQYGFEISYADATKPEEVAAAIRPETRIVWIETPSNPFMRLCDIRAVAEITHKAGALLVVDNTFMSPYFQRPLDLGADIVTYSATKYISGHSDVLAGALLTNDKLLAERIYLQQNATGAVLSPFDSYLVLRGLKTLELRMERHQQNALQIARFLETHPRVERVFYPGLESHPQYALGKEQMTGFGGMLSFLLRGDKEYVEAFMGGLRLIPMAVSLGGVESLIEVPAYFSHASVAPEIRLRSGITDNLVRLSAGIENTGDLINDLRTALTSA